MIRRSLTLKIVLGLLLLTIFIAIPTITLTYRYQIEILTDHTEKEYKSNTLIASTILEDAIEKEDLQLLSKYLKLIQEKGEFAFIAIVEDSEIFICQPPSLRTQVFAENPDYNYYRERLNSDLFKDGFLIVASSTEQDEQVISKLSTPILYLAIIAGIITLVLVWVINKGISKPLVKAERIATELSKYNYQIPIAISTRGDEIGRLLSAFQNLKEQLLFYQQETENFTQTLQSEISVATKDLEIKKRYSDTLFNLAQQLIFAGNDEREPKQNGVRTTIENISEQLNFDLIAIFSLEDCLYSSTDLSLKLGLPQSPIAIESAEIAKLEANKVILINQTSAKKIFGDDSFNLEPSDLLLFKFQDFNEDTCVILIANLFHKGEVDLLNLTKFLEMYAALYISYQRFKISEHELLNLNKHLETKVLQKVKENLEISNNLVALDKLATLGEMSASVAHDLNTPLGAIQASSENIEFLLCEILNKIQGLSKFETKLLCELVNRFSPEEWYARENNSDEEVKELTQLLNKSLKQPLDPNLAKMLVRAGFSKNDEQAILEITSLHDTQRFLSLCTDFYELRTFNSAIITSVSQGAKVVRGLSKFISEDLNQTPIPINLKNSFEIIQGLFKHRFREINSFEIQVDPTIMVLGIEVKIFQLWSNILKNALDALAEQDSSENKHKVIKVKAKTEEGKVIIDITNNGPEIPKEIQKKIFSKFFTTKQDRNGTGLGLSIVSSVISQHRGSFELISDKKWTTFRFYLPTGKVS